MTKFLGISTDNTLGGDNTSDVVVSSQKAIKAFVEGKVSVKQDTLISGTNIKTINGTSILGSGDISTAGAASWGNIGGTLSNQTDLQNALNAKQNTISDLSTIRSGAAAGATAVQPASLATVATSGSYNDLTNKPTIPAAQVQTDWNATSGMGVLLNKPTLATVATSGSYNDLTNKPTSMDGVTNKNAASGATNPIYDWVGTLAQYTSQAIATNHPDWICYITDDDEASTYDAYTKGQTNDLLAAKANAGHEVIGFQAPTAANDYTWYRLYADGWVEQGGEALGTGTDISILLPVTMENSRYNCCLGLLEDTTGSNNTEGWVRTRTETTLTVRVASAADGLCWMVSGMAAA